MKSMTTAVALTIMASSLATLAMAEVDLAKGEKLFKKCKACHMIVNGDEVIFKGGRTGPNLYGIIGRSAASFEGFNYSKSLVAAGEAGLVWDPEIMAAYVVNPKAFLKEYLDDSGAKSAMSFRLKKGGKDVAAYLASVGPVMETVDVEVVDATETDAVEETTTEETN
ncbi:cytochrome C550 [Marinosulfonomonas sp. PRT-SC04]|nr:cytochrome C550 [Marinosulfonomonas sp. PRT-SC04]